MSDRFFFDGPLALGDVTLTDHEAHHLATVRRFVVGDPVTLFNGDGHEYPARIVDIGKKRATLQVTGVESPDCELGIALHIASAMPKGDRGDFLIEKLTELGIAEFTPLVTERVVVKPDGKSDKWRRAVIEASKQCGRNVLMRIHPPVRWLEWCVQQTGRRIVVHPSGQWSVVSGQRSDATIAVGPEGGFTESEVQIAVAAGWELRSLGPRILRVETAALTAAVLFGSQ